ncbi:MAG TPA: hypothetical protein VFR18_15675 [Terriglobia bacterium]|nr:hypothetical protein [Terriglobia bacterium]
MTLPELARQSVTDYIVNPEFTEASLFFEDGSFLQFVHKARDQRWARPSADDTIAGRVCQGLRQFRLNAKHLQLFFEDDDVEFFARTSEA